MNILLWNCNNGINKPKQIDYFKSFQCDLAVIPELKEGNIRIIDRIENWQGTGKIFEYYRRELDPDRIYAPKTDPPNITRV